MCRLYGLQATHPTRPACELLDAQNALIRQSREDARGLSNPHGWGMGQIANGTTSCFRQVKPASESPDYRAEALATEGTTVLAHVRRATDAEFQSLSHDELEQFLGLNLLWTDGDTLGGSRLNRTLWVRRRDRVHTCSLCGRAHADPPPDADYRSVTLASERLTDEDWTEVPNGSVFQAAPDGTLHLEALDET